MEEFKKALKDPIVQQIIAGLVVAAIPAAFGLIYAYLGLQGVLGLGIVSAVLLLTVLLLWPKLRQRVFSQKPKALPKSADPLASGTIPQSELIDRFHLRRNQIIIRIHDEYAINLDNRVRAAFNERNIRRKSQGLLEDEPLNRFRLICPPKPTDIGRELHLAPINYAYFALMIDPEVSASVKDYIREQIHRVASRISKEKEFQTNHPSMNGDNWHPIGIHMIVVTKDKKTLFRRRGASVLMGSKKWDSSISGFCGEVDLVNEELDLGRTAKNELREEICVLPADTNEIIFTGFYLHTTGGVDVLGIWRTEAKTNELIECIAKNHRGTTMIFETTEPTEEQFVRDTMNLIVDFQGGEISKAFSQAKIELIPQAFACLVLALEADGQSTSELIR